MFPEISMILRQQAILDYPKIVAILELFRLHSESFVAILARSLTHGTDAACQGSFFANPSASDEPAASSSRHVYARSPTATHGEPAFFA